MAHFLSSFVPSFGFRASLGPSASLSFFSACSARYCSYDLVISSGSGCGACLDGAASLAAGAAAASPFSSGACPQSVPPGFDSSVFHALPAAARFASAATIAGVLPQSPPVAAFSTASSALAMASPACSSFHSDSPVGAPQD